MDNAGLHSRPREDSSDGAGEALETVDHCEDDVLNTAVFEFVHDPQPELGALAVRTSASRSIPMAFSGV